jgi:hypothetical protein
VESNAVRYWKENFADIEKKKDELAKDLNEIKEEKDNKSIKNSQLTQTDEQLPVSTSTIISYPARGREGMYSHV